MNTVITTASSLYVVLYTIWLIIIFVIFANLNPLEQHRTAITNELRLLVYVLAIISLAVV